MPVSDLRSICFLALIPIIGGGLLLLMARLSGWSQLAHQFRCKQPVAGEVARLRTGRLGAIHYYSCLRFCVNGQGLMIAIAPPFRLGHPPLFVPWDQIHNVSADTLLYSRKVKLSIGRPTITRATLPGWVRYRMPMKIRP